MSFASDARKKILEARGYTFEDVNKAFETLGLKAGEYDKVDSAYKQMAKKNHPDLGGSTEKMAEINNAKDAIEGGPRVNSKGGFAGHNSSQAKEREEREFKMKHVTDTLKLSVIRAVQDLRDSYCEYFANIFSKEFTSELSKVRDGYLNSFSLSARFTSDDSKTIFELNISIEVDWRDIDTALSTDSIDYSAAISTFGYDNGKKQKMTQRDYRRGVLSTEIKNPESVFPKKQLQKMLNPDKSKKGFKRADAIAFFKKEMNALEADSGSMFIPLKDDLYAGFYRTTFLGKGAWSFLGIRKKVSYSFKKEWDEAHFTIWEYLPDFVDIIREGVDYFKQGRYEAGCLAIKAATEASLKSIGENFMSEKSKKMPLAEELLKLHEQDVEIENADDDEGSGNQKLDRALNVLSKKPNSVKAEIAPLLIQELIKKVADLPQGRKILKEFGADALSLVLKGETIS
jgi:hypothetical protein